MVIKESVKTSISLEFETKDEVLALVCILSHNKICEFARSYGLDLGKIRDYILSGDNNNDILSSSGINKTPYPKVWGDLIYYLYKCK